MQSARIFEEHSSVLPEFWGLGRGERTLVCLDAHLDLQAISAPLLALLQRCESVAEVKALEKPHHLMPDRGYAYSLEDWLFPAHRLGLFHHLVWVAPPHVRVELSAAVVAHLEQMDGVMPSELASFRPLPGGGFRGTLAGVPITLCSHAQLAALELSGPVLLDIDTDYFVEVPGDRAWIDPAEVLQTVRAALPEPELVTISRSEGSGFLPLRYRYFADYLSACWEERRADADHYQRLFRLDDPGVDPGTRALGLAQECERFPDCAATWHLRSLADSASTESLAQQDRATRLDAAYRQDSLTRACAYPQRRLPVSADACLTLQGLLASESLPPWRQACAQAAVGHVWCALGLIDAAIACHGQCSAHFGTHPALALEIGKALLARGRAPEAVGFLKAALDDDTSRNSARVYLAELYARAGRNQLALEHAAAAFEAAPAWSQVAWLLARIHRQLGHTDTAAEIESRQRELARERVGLLGTAAPANQGAGAS